MALGSSDSVSKHFVYSVGHNLNALVSLLVTILIPSISAKA